MEGEREGKGRGGEGRQERGGTPARKRHPPVLPDSLCKALGSQWGGAQASPHFQQRCSEAAAEAHSSPLQTHHQGDRLPSFSTCHRGLRQRSQPPLE